MRDSSVRDRAAQCLHAQQFIQLAAGRCGRRGRPALTVTGEQPSVSARNRSPAGRRGVDGPRCDQGERVEKRGTSHTISEEGTSRASGTPRRQLNDAHDSLPRHIEGVAPRVSEDTLFSKVRLNLSNIKATLLPTPRLYVAVIDNLLRFVAHFFAESREYLPS